MICDYLGDTRVQEYVAGFLFLAGGSQVLLIRKARPAWQAGKLNGVGGKIEHGETPLDAMCREFKEETSLDVSDWKEFCELRGKAFTVHFFCAYSSEDHLKVTGDPSEPLVIAGVDNYDFAIPNVSWLIHMALSMCRGERATKFVVYEH